MSYAKYDVHGEYYHADSIGSIGIPNPDYSLGKDAFLEKYSDGTTVYKYKFDIHTVELVPEPTNKADPNAIKVIMNGAHVGYVPRESTDRVREHMNSGRIENIKGKMSFGPNKTAKTSMSSGKRYVRYENGDYMGTFTIYLRDDKKPTQKPTGCCFPFFAVPVIVISVFVFVIRAVLHF